LFAFPGLAQDGTFDLTGEILDQQNAAIVNAEVVLIDANGTESKRTSNSLGNIEFRRLPYGKFRLKVSADGFAEYEAEFHQTSAAKAGPLKVVLFPIVRERVSVSGTDERPLASTSAGEL
jgi:hypothetical protein